MANDLAVAVAYLSGYDHGVSDREKYESRLNTLRECIDTKDAEIDRLRHALEKYANPHSWLSEDDIGIEGLPAESLWRHPGYGWEEAAAALKSGGVSDEI